MKSAPGHILKMKLWHHAKRFFRDQRGVSGIEYAVLGGAILTVILLSIPDLSSVFDDLGAALADLDGGNGNGNNGNGNNGNGNGNGNNGNGNNGNGNGNNGNGNGNGSP